MRIEDLAKPSVPIAYGRLILDVAAEHGVSRDAMLAHLNISAEQLDTSSALLTAVQASRLLYRALKLSQDPALGYEIGLRSSVTSHGFVGYGAMSAQTLRDAIEFGIKFLQLRLPILRIELLVEGQQAVIQVTEKVPLGFVRQSIFDLFLAGLWRMIPQLLGEKLPENHGVEFCFDYPEPDYYRRYRSRLPPTRFSMPTNQIRFRADSLNYALNTADPASVQLVTQQCERELSMLGYTGDFLSRVKSILVNQKCAYPDQEAAAAALHVSSRTLKRRLQEYGVTYQGLLNEVRKSDSIRLLADASLTVIAVAELVGYHDPANFTRAFRKWTGMSPSEYRAGMPQR